ncbi:membrane protein [Pseudoalteromonas luteoviolacea]|uniref:Membrane protein n=1 Tax=Pseudoalteromonas luteoviolacea TaxID=43657 RepID=A0A023PYJ9_9GAMM|nr:hypothetical protein [Pseudoalteromonas luteoviolacea]AHX39654.1 hypothetical protein [Pseudoalteromonas luteoviolacea]KID56798.1 membrane protein [Pseudoalteromonas luteoviolacea]
MKKVATAIGISMFSPLIVGTILGAYFYIVTGQGQVFLQLLTTAISNAHIVGIVMALCVLPTYLFLYKRDKLSYAALTTAAMLGGAVFTFFFSISGGPILIANAVMCALASALFLYSLRRPQ